MPVRKVGNKWVIGSGKAIYKTKAAAKRAYKAYLAKKHMIHKVGDKWAIGNGSAIYKTRAAAEAALSMVLAFDTSSFIAVSAARKEGGVSVQRFRKELIRVGRFVKVEDDLVFEVKPETLKHWVACFAKMQEVGEKVHVPLGHNNAGNPEKNKGWLASMFIEGDSLIGLIDLVGEDAAELAKQNDISIFVPPEWVDGKGNKYTQPIQHIALTPVPVIPGLGKFVPVAASHGQINVPVLTLAEENPMLDLTKVAEALGITEELTEENAETLILDAITALKAKVSDEGEVKAGEEGDKKTTVEATGQKPSKILVTLARDNRVTKIDALLEAGKITPDVRKQLVEQYTTEEHLTLSLSASDGKATDDFDAVIKMFEANEPINLGEKTSAQSVELSKTLDPKTNPLIADAEKRAKAEE